MLATYRCGVTDADASPPKGISRYGAIPPNDGDRGLPTALPAVHSLVLDFEAAGVGFAVMSGLMYRVASVPGNSITRQGISLP